MKVDFPAALVFLLIFGSWADTAVVFAASSGPASLAAAKQQSEALGYIFLNNHEEIVAAAKKEGKMRALSSHHPAALKAMVEGFKAKYPFLDAYAEELSGTEAIQRFTVEVKAGGAKDWDANYAAPDFYNEYPPYQKKFDILGMAKAGVLKIPVEMIDPVNRTIVSMTSSIQVVGYNKKLVAADKVPTRWVDFLKPEFKGRKFVVDIRPEEIAALVPLWGLEKSLDFARKIAAQQPVWGRGGTRVLTAVVAGEYPIFMGANLGTAERVQAKDPTGNLAYKILEPLSVRVDNTDGVLATASHPHAALLWLEFQCSPEGQKILDQQGPYQASIFFPGSALEKLSRGKERSLVNWDHYSKMQGWVEKVVEAYGFPKTETKR